MALIPGIDIFFDEGFFPDEEDFDQPPPIPPPVATPVPVEPPDDGGFFNFPDLGAITEYITELGNDLAGSLGGLTDRLASFERGVEASIGGALRSISLDVEDAATSTIDKVSEGVEDITGTVTREATRLSEKIGDTVDAGISTLDDTIEGVSSSIGGKVSAVSQALEDEANRITGLVGGVADEVLTEVDDIIAPIVRKAQGVLAGEIDALELSISTPLTFLQENIPLQLQGLGDIIETSLSGITELPETLVGGLSGIVDGLVNTLGVDQLIGLFQLWGRVTDTLSGRLPGDATLNVQPGSWDVPRGVADQANITLASLPIIGQIIQVDHSAEFDRIRVENLDWVRPFPLDQGSILESLRRRVGDPNELRSDLGKLGISDERIAQLERIINAPLPVLDKLDAWKRGFYTDAEITDQLHVNGLSDDDIGIATRLASRLPPIQDQILFAIRGVFDIEESRKFGEFEGLPSSIEASFVSDFGIEGGDFSRQVEVFAREAGKLGLDEKWVAAYWTSHWRLPSLQAGYEMFHRLAPDIVAAESEDFIADGFNPDDIKMGEDELNRLVRSSDFSSFWRPKLQAIAYNPLTRVDIRRMHKLGVLDDDAMERAYRKVGFSPSDAAKMKLFTIAFNKSPDDRQSDEVRDLTKAQILDFVEHSLFTPDEGVLSLQEIGYDEFAAQGFVELELAKRDRNAQKQTIDLIQEQTLAGIIDINEAGQALDSVGVGSEQKAVVLRELDIKLAKRTRQPTRAELDKFLEEAIIGVEDYEIGMLSLGYPQIWVDRFVALNNPA